MKNKDINMIAKLQVSKSKASQVIASLNKELKDLGKLTVAAKSTSAILKKS